MPLPKPESCKGCPFYELSPYITPDNYVPDSEICIVAQAPGEHEEQGRHIIGETWYKGKKQELCDTVHPQPLIGRVGKWLQDEFWPRTGIPYTQVSTANIIKCRPHGKNDLPSIGSTKAVNGITVKMLKEAIAHCTRAHLHIPESTHYIMAMGGISLYALTGLQGKDNGITNWRGWILGRNTLYESILDYGHILGSDAYYEPIRHDPYIVNIYPVIHLASLFEKPTLYRATLNDFTKFGKLVREEWPVSLPHIHINEQPLSIPKYIGFDTEYDVEDNNRLEMWSLADVQGNIYVMDVTMSNVLSTPYIHPDTTVVTQNGLVDLPHFRKVFNTSSIRLEDCMLAWSTLFPGEPTNLDYMTSIAGGYNRHKHIRTVRDRDSKYLYSGLDADTPLNHVWKYLLNHFKHDRQSWVEYVQRRQPLLGVIERFQNTGIEVWDSRVEEIGTILDREMMYIQERAKEITGNPTFNIASVKQVSEGIYESEET